MCAVVHCSAEQHRAIQCSTVQYKYTTVSAIQYIQHGTVQYSKVPVHYSSAHDNLKNLSGQIVLT